MKIGPLDTNKKIVTIAEIGNNHEGDFGRAKELVLAAADAGADIVKFQTIRAEKFCSVKNTTRFATLKSFEFSIDQFAELSKVAEAAKVLFMSTPFDLEAVSQLQPLVPAFKIASGDLTFVQLLREVGKTAKPVILSTGMSSLDEVAQAREILLASGAKEIAVLHCSVAYPTPLKEANLRAISKLKARFGGAVGYSDHTLGIEACLFAVASGAKILEKHFTLDKNQSSFRDHQLSADPKDLRLLISRIKEVEEMLGSGEKVVQESEAANLTAVRRSIVAGRPLRAGTVISESDITWMRPASGYKPGEEARVIGRLLSRDLETGDPIGPGDLGGD